MTSVYHTPVLLEESVRLLDIDPAGTYVDLTFGGGGHSRRILSALGDRGRLYAFDRDRDTRDNCPEDSRFHYVESNFRFMRGRPAAARSNPGRWYPGRPGRVVPPFRCRRTGILVPGFGTARHADEPARRRHGGRPGEHARRRCPDPHPGRLGRNRHPLESRRLHRPRTDRAADPDHRRPGCGRSALYPEKRTNRNSRPSCSRPCASK